MLWCSGWLSLLKYCSSMLAFQNGPLDNGFGNHRPHHMTGAAFYESLSSILNFCLIANQSYASQRARCACNDPCSWRDRAGHQWLEIPRKRKTLSQLNLVRKIFWRKTNQTIGGSERIPTATQGPYDETNRL